MASEPLRVLLVEDEPAHAVLIQRELQDFAPPTAISHVIDGQAALDYLFGSGDDEARGASARPELILLDLRLPKIDGLDVLKRLRASEEFKTLPVIVVSTSNSEKDIDTARNYGISGYFVKPVSLDSMRPLLQDLVSKST